jgi:hypothetical protein
MFVARDVRLSPIHPSRLAIPPPRTHLANTALTPGVTISNNRTYLEQAADAYSSYSA